jgi:hypothetical protein
MYPKTLKSAIPWTRDATTAAVNGFFSALFQEFSIATESTVQTPSRKKSRDTAETGLLVEARTQQAFV